MSVKLVAITDTNPSTPGCSSLVEYDYETWHYDAVRGYNSKPERINETIQIVLTDSDIVINKLTWGGLSKELIFKQDLHSFIDVFSQHPKFKKLPSPTLLKAVTEIALSVRNMQGLLGSIQQHLRLVKKLNKKISKQPTEEKDAVSKSGVKSIADLAKYITLTATQAVNLAVEDQRKGKGLIPDEDEIETKLILQTSIFLAYIASNTIVDDNSLNEADQNKLVSQLQSEMALSLYVDEEMFNKVFYALTLKYLNCDKTVALDDTFGDVLSISSELKKNNPTIAHLMEYIGFYSSTTIDSYNEMRKVSKGV